MKIEPNKAHSIHLRLTDAQYSYCSENATAMGVGVSDFVRMAINGLMVSTEKLRKDLAEKEVDKANKTLGDLENENNKDIIEYQL